MVLVQLLICCVCTSAIVAYHHPNPNPHPHPQPYPYPLPHLTLGLVLGSGLGMRGWGRRPTAGRHLLHMAKGKNTIKFTSEVVETRKVQALREGMSIKRIADSELCVSEVCLGTMTFGNQNTKEEAHAQLDLAFDEFGVNFIDTAEMYPVPPEAETAGNTDKIIGQWLKKRKRSDVILASKVSGYAEHLPWLRKQDKVTRLTERQIIESVDASLARLQTDYVDLMQIHWPDRYVPLWGDELYEVSEEREAVSFEEQLRAFDRLIKAGKVRYIGLSNETPWGVAQFSAIAKQMGLPRPISVQNSYNLLCRSDVETHLVEACAPSNGNMGILAYSPLAGGALTGKYLNKATAPRDGRLIKFYGYMVRYLSDVCKEATTQYMRGANHMSLPLTVLALSWVYTRPFITSTIVGATSTQQLEDNILALNAPHLEEFEQIVQKIYRRYSDPTKGPQLVFDPFDDDLTTYEEDEAPWSYTLDIKDVDIEGGY